MLVREGKENQLPEDIHQRGKEVCADEKYFQDKHTQQLQQEQQRQLQQELQHLKEANLSFVRNIEFIPAHSAGDNTGCMCLIKGPPSSPYGGYSYPVQLLIPPTYPVDPPMVRFGCVITHSQLTSTGAVPALIYNSDNLDWNSTTNRNLTNLLVAVYNMLSEPLKEVLPDKSDAELFHDFMHEAKGVCVQVGTADYDEKHAHEVVEQLRKVYPVEVRKRFDTAAAYMARVIATQHKYAPLRLHPEIFSVYSGWQPNWFDPAFMECLASTTPAQFGTALMSITTQVAEGVYSFPLFSPLYCELLLEETNNFEHTKLFKSRPNSMNIQGLVINDIGLESMIDALIAQYLLPITTYLYPLDGGSSLDHHHSFIVQYECDGDVNLDMHTDDSDITLNVCISPKFTGGELDFCGHRGKKNHRKYQGLYQHALGRGVLHLGTHRHGARDIRSGQRSNLIIWCRSSSYRNTPKYHDQKSNHDKEDKPDIVCLSHTHDRDYQDCIRTLPKIEV